jgi:uncharacterized protein
MSNITVEKHNHLGEPVVQYQGEVLKRTDQSVCLRAIYNRPESDFGFVVFRPGDLFIEWFYSDRWYNIFQVHEGESARIKGWYCNVTRPAYIAEDVISADDLEVDVFVFPNGNIALLDEEEFSQLDLPTEERMEALHAIQSIRQAVTNRQPPFDQIR